MGVSKWKICDTVVGVIIVKGRTLKSGLETVEIAGTWINSAGHRPRCCQNLSVLGISRYALLVCLGKL